MDEPIATRRKLFKDASWCTAWWHTKQIQQLKQGRNEDGRFQTNGPTQNYWKHTERSFFWRNPWKSWIASMAWPTVCPISICCLSTHPEWNQTSGSILDGRDFVQELLVEYHPDKNSSSHAKEVFQPLGSNLIAQVPQVLWRGWMGFFTGHPKCVNIYPVISMINCYVVSIWWNEGWNM